MEKWSKKLKLLIPQTQKKQTRKLKFRRENAIKNLKVGVDIWRVGNRKGVDKEN